MSQPNDMLGLRRIDLIREKSKKMDNADILKTFEKRNLSSLDSEELDQLITAFEETHKDLDGADPIRKLRDFEDGKIPNNIEFDSD